MYVELHATSAFSFLEAAGLPEALAEEAARLGQPALALLDRDGVYGAPRLYRACTRLGLTALVGAEVTLSDGGGLPPPGATPWRSTPRGWSPSPAATRAPSRPGSHAAARPRPAASSSGWSR